MSSIAKKWIPMPPRKIPDTPLLFFQPYNIVVFLAFYSPIVLCIVMLSLSFIFQNFKGFIYLAFLLGVCLIRTYFYALSGATPLIPNGTICTSIQYTKYANSTFSAFVFAFTITYLLYPMITNGEMNFYVIIGLLMYFFFDMLIKMSKQCTIDMGQLLLNILTGAGASALIVTLMYSGGSSDYLFFNEVSSNKEVCSMPTKQTFKCAVYKNGELISNINA